MKTMRYEKPKSPGVTVLKIFLCTFLIAIAAVSLSVPALDRLDKFMDNMNHQLYTVIAITSITVVAWIIWRVKK